MNENKLPEQEKGNQSNNQLEKEFETLDEAKNAYISSVAKLKNISKWHDIAKDISGHFLLTDEQGNELTAEPQIGNLIRIILPAPNNLIGDGNDWVRIEAIEKSVDQEKDYELFLLRIRPTHSPFSNKDETAHFFTDESTNNFMIEREKNILKVGVYGRNEVSNYEQSSGLNKLRNHGIALGAMFGFSAIQWKSLIKGILE